MPEIGPSGSMSGEWKRSFSHRATLRLYPILVPILGGNWLWSDDRAFPAEHPIPIHDAVVTAETD
jgi:hypothetical protein